MKICKLLHPEQVILDARAPDKEAALRMTAEILSDKGVVEHPERLYEELRAREGVMSTGIGGGFAVPHAASDEAGETGLLLLRLAGPVDFQSIDEKPVDVILAVVVPRDYRSLHLQILAAISRLCRKTDFLEAVRKARDPEALLRDIEVLEERIAFH